MITVRDSYDMAMYGEATSNSQKLVALSRLVVHHTGLSYQEVEALPLTEFYTKALDIMRALNATYVPVPDAFAVAFKCQKPCCTTSILSEIQDLLNRWVHLTTLLNDSLRDSMQESLVKDTNALGYRIHLVRRSVS